MLVCARINEKKTELGSETWIVPLIASTDHDLESGLPNLVHYRPQRPRGQILTRTPVYCNSGTPNFKFRQRLHSEQVPATTP
jgi:hypothetical protein